MLKCRSCYGGMGHHKPKRCDWFWAASCREDKVFGICSSSLHTVSTFPGSPFLIPLMLYNSMSHDCCWCTFFTCVQVGRTLSRVQQAFGWSYGEEIKPFKPPLSDSEFHSYLNAQGQLTRPEELRLRIYHGGVEPSLRKVECMYFIQFQFPYLQSVVTLMVFM